MDFAQTMMLLVGSLLGFFILMLLVRYSLGLDGAYKRQQHQIRLLKEIAQKQGVSIEELKKIEDSVWS